MRVSCKKNENKTAKLQKLSLFAQVFVFYFLQFFGFVCFFFFAKVLLLESLPPSPVVTSEMCFVFLSTGCQTSIVCVCRGKRVHPPPSLADSNPLMAKERHQILLKNNLIAQLRPLFDSKCSRASRGILRILAEPYNLFSQTGRDMKEWPLVVSHYSQA